MYCRHHSATALVAIVAGVIALTNAQAGSRVGGATIVVRDVSSSLSGTSWAKKVKGDDVYENEFVRTEAESSARISFIDETDIRIGPTATMKIDRVVFKSNRSVEELIVSAETGAMRWNSGTSPSGAYQVKTPDAIIRPLGTAFDLLVDSQRTIVVLRRGQIEVSSIDAPQRCQTLSRPGDTIIATPNDLERPQRVGPGPSEFADRCLSANMMAPCVIMASVQPTKSGSVTPSTTGSGTSPATGTVTPPTTEIVTLPTGRVEPPYVPSVPPVVVVTPNGPGGEPLPSGCYRDQRRLKCQPPASNPPVVKPSGPNDGLSPGQKPPVYGKPSGSGDRVSQVNSSPNRNCSPYRGRLACQPSMPSSPRRVDDSESSRRAGDSALAYVKPSSPKQTYVKPTVRPTYVRPTVTQSYVRPIVRPTYVRPTPRVQRR